MIYVVPNVTFSGAAKSLDGKRLSLLHFCLISTFDNWNTFPSMDRILDYVVAVEVPDALDWE